MPHSVEPPLALTVESPLISAVFPKPNGQIEQVLAALMNMPSLHLVHSVAVFVQDSQEASQVVKQTASEVVAATVTPTSAAFPLVEIQGLQVPDPAQKKLSLQDTQ